VRGLNKEEREKRLGEISMIIELKINELKITLIKQREEEKKKRREKEEKDDKRYRKSYKRNKRE